MWYNCGMIYFNHMPGDGVHYINNNARSFPDGSTQEGDTSDLCILLNLELILAHNGSDMSVPDLWNGVYPEDFMSEQDFGFILSVSIDGCGDFDPTAPDNITAVLDDLVSMGCPELAEAAKSCLNVLR